MSQIVQDDNPYDGFDINCPNCGSANILLKDLGNGIYDIYKCHKCGYKNKELDE